MFTHISGDVDVYGGGAARFVFDIYDGNMNVEIDIIPIGFERDVFFAPNTRISYDKGSLVIAINDIGELNQTIIVENVIFVNVKNKLGSIQARVKATIHPRN